MVGMIDDNNQTCAKLFFLENFLGCDDDDDHDGDGDDGIHPKYLRNEYL